MASLTDILAYYSYIWRFDDIEEEKYEVYAKRNDLISFRVFTITIMLDKVLIRVSNEGEPIPDVLREKLFTFQIRSLQGTANEAGTGLGLAMSRQFALLNNGKLTLELRTEGFNTFTLELPFIDSDPSSKSGSILSTFRDSLNKGQC